MAGMQGSYNGGIMDLSNIVPLRLKKEKKKSSKRKGKTPTCMHVRNKHMLSAILQRDLQNLYGISKLLRGDIAALADQEQLCGEGKNEEQTQRIRHLLELGFVVEDLNKEMNMTIVEYLTHLPLMDN